MSAVTTVTKTKEAAIRPTFPIAHDRLTMDAADAASSLFSPTPHESGPRDSAEIPDCSASSSAVDDGGRSDAASDDSGDNGMKTGASQTHQESEVWRELRLGGECQWKECFNHIISTLQHSCDYHNSDIIVIKDPRFTPAKYGSKGGEYTGTTSRIYHDPRSCKGSATEIDLGETPCTISDMSELVVCSEADGFGQVVAFEGPKSVNWKHGGRLFILTPDDMSCLSEYERGLGGDDEEDDVARGTLVIVTKDPAYPHRWT